MADGRVVIATDIDSGKVVKGLGDIDKAMKDTGEESKIFTGGIDIMDLAFGNLIAGGIEGAIQGIIQFSGELINTYGEMGRMAEVVGFNTDEYQRWDGVMQNVGWSMEQAQGDLSQMAEKALDAANATGEGAEFFGMLGIEVTDMSGKLKDSQVIFAETIEALQGMENQTERNAIASSLFSTTGEMLVPILNMTNEELEKMKGNVNVVPDETIDSIREFQETWSEVSKTLMNIAAVVLTPFLELLNGILEFFFVWDDTATSTTKNIEKTMTSSNSKVEDGQKQHYDKMISMAEGYSSDLSKLTDAEKEWRQSKIREWEEDNKKMYDMSNLNSARAYQSDLDKYKQKLDRQLGLDEEYLKEKSDMYKRWLDTNQITLDKYNQLMGSIGGGSSYSQSRSVSNTTNYNTYNVSGNEAYGFMKEQVNINRRL